MLFSDVDTSNIYFRLWFVLIPVMYFFLVILFRLIGLYDFKTWKGSRASDIVAFEIIAGISVTYLGIWGIICKFNLFNFEDLNQLSSTSFYTRSITVENHIVYPMMVFQCWNVLLCLFCRDLRDPAMIGHHTITAICASFTLHPCMQYYSIYTLGLTELSGIPLTAIDIFKYFPELATKYPTVHLIARFSFAILFYVLRIIYMPFVMIPFMYHICSLLIQGKAHSIPVFVFVLISSVFMIGLQFLWAYKIAIYVRKLVYATESKLEKKN